MNTFRLISTLSLILESEQITQHFIESNPIKLNFSDNPTRIMTFSIHDIYSSVLKLTLNGRGL